MSKASRDKGARGEREFCKVMNEFGHNFSRNLVQTRNGGHDIVGVDSVAIEVKRCEKLSLNKWYAQCIQQAEEADAVPVLAWRKSKEPWNIAVFMNPSDFDDYLNWRHEK